MDLHPTAGAGAPVGVDDVLLLAAEAVAVLAGTDYMNLPSTVAVVVAGIGVDIALLAVAGAAAVVVHADAVHC